MRHDRSLRLLAAGALLVVAGCGAPSPDTLIAGPVEPDGTRAAQGTVKCPDQNSCTLSNGTGVYYAEKGSAGLDDKLRLLITHFDNTEKPPMTFTGRYFDADQGTWQYLPTPGLVETAIFNGDDYDVLAIHEHGSSVEFTLQWRKDPSVIVVAREKDLLSLTLRLRIENPMLRGKLSFYLLQFTAVAVDGNLWIYMPEWRLDTYGTQFQPYCLDAYMKPDSAAFQEGIQVDPTNGMTTTGAPAELSVTFSCRLGAPATCEFWGYDTEKHEPNFKACIHMKRASYCADGNAYTYTGTKLLVLDSDGLWQDKITAQTIEAKWTDKGASCVTYPRHPALGFNFMCNGNAVKPCPTNPIVDPKYEPVYLVSGNP